MKDAYRAGANVTAQEASETEEQLLLFTTKTCPNCRIAKEMLRNEPYEIVDAEERTDLVAKFGIMQAPTLVVMQGDAVTKYVNASNIKRFVDGRMRMVSNA